MLAPFAAGFATPRLAIEPLSPAHADGLFAALDHPDVNRYLPAPDVTTIEALRARLAVLEAPSPPAGERWWNFAVRLAEGAAGSAAEGAAVAVIGRLEATTYGPWGEIAYVFGRRWWGRGLASEATRWLTGHLASCGVAELWAAVHPANAASLRLLARIGFRAAPPARPLASFDAGDAVLVWRA